MNQTRSQEIGLHDATIMACRTRAAARGATPADMQREVDRISQSYGLDTVWASMLAMDKLARSLTEALGDRLVRS